MTDKRYNYHETVEVRVLVTPQAATILRRDTLNSPISIATLAGQILTRAVLQIETERKNKEAAERFAKLKGSPETRTVLELSEVYTPQQISSILRLPYKAVMAELGKQVDTAAARGNDAEDMPHSYGARP